MTAVAVAAPACPVWCAVHEAGAGWDELGRDVTKTCRLETHPATDVDGVPVLVQLSRFADLDEGVVEVGPPDVQIQYSGRMSREQTARLAVELGRLARLSDT